MSKPRPQSRATAQLEPQPKRDAAGTAIGISNKDPSGPAQGPLHHPTLTSLARLLGRQVAREASSQGGSNG